MARSAGTARRCRKSYVFELALAFLASRAVRRSTALGEAGADRLIEPSPYTLPDTGIEAPVMARAASDARKAMTSASAAG